PRVDFENRHPGFDARHRDLDDPVETARPQEGFVQDVRSVRRSDDLDLAERIEAVEFGEELHEGPLDFPISRGRDLEALRADGVEFVDENDRGRLFPRELEQLADEPRPFADVLLDEFGAYEADERRLRPVRHGLRQERRTGPWRPDAQDALGRLDADLAIQLVLQDRVLQR